MAEDVSAFIKDHGLTDTTIIGHSMGAKTAMTLALRSPDAVANIVAVDNAPVDAALRNDFAHYIRGMEKIQSAGITRQAEADQILQKYEESLPIRQFLLGNLYRPPGGNFSSSASHSTFSHDPGERRFQKPALFVRGTKSTYVPDDVLPAIGQFFPLFRVADIDAGHWLISEQPEAFRQAVVDFLRDVE
ncbi:hypothetical protein ACCO45_010787 [Purpureocillium lilacinum]|uniref:Uncharacterized protein n=1 Tax=Purpureocillium lilacinum TaxID=33203 RepID=A0ACC4DH81_PURLI